MRDQKDDLTGDDNRMLLAKLGKGVAFAKSQLKRLRQLKKLRPGLHVDSS